MITKLTDQVTTDLLEFFNKYGIKLSAQYTPELPGVSSYAHNFLASAFSLKSLDIDGTKYQNKLLYRVATPKPAEFSPHNNNLSLISGYDQVSQNYTISKTSDTITKVRTGPDNGLVKVRDVSIMEIPLEFLIITDDVELIFAVSLLFHQQLVLLNTLEVSLDLFNDGVLTTLPYFMNWDRESLEISYANFENSSALNTLAFNMKISGALFSAFYSEDYTINSYNIQIKVN